MVYGNKPEMYFVIEILIWSVAMYLLGKVIFKLFINRIMVRL